MPINKRLEYDIAGTLSITIRFMCANRETLVSPYYYIILNKMLNKIITCKVPSCLLKTNIRVWLNCLMRIQRDSLIRRVVLGPNFFYVAFDMHPIQENRALRPSGLPYNYCNLFVELSRHVPNRSGASPLRTEHEGRADELIELLA